MSIGLIGRKTGMTRVFTEDGVSIPVTVVEVEPNRVSQVKSVETDGYYAVQLTAGTRRANRVTKSQAGHFAKASVEAGVFTREFTLKEAAELKAGEELTVVLFEAGQRVDVTGTSRVKASLVRSSATTSACKTQLTVTHCLTAHRALSASARRQVVCGKARRCLATWVLSALLCSHLRSFASTQSVTCC